MNFVISSFFSSLVFGKCAFRGLKSMLASTTAVDCDFAAQGKYCI